MGNTPLFYDMGEEKLSLCHTTEKEGLTCYSYRHDLCSGEPTSDRWTLDLAAR